MEPGTGKSAHWCDASRERGKHANDGQPVWKKTVAFNKEMPTHKTNPYGGSTPASDGQHVVVWHGSAGLYAYDIDGKELWLRDLGDFKHMWGYGSSPVIAGDLLETLGYQRGTGAASLVPKAKAALAGLGWQAKRLQAKAQPMARRMLRRVRSSQTLSTLLADRRKR